MGNQRKHYATFSALITLFASASAHAEFTTSATPVTQRGQYQQAIDGTNGVDQPHALASAAWDKANLACSVVTDGYLKVANDAEKVAEQSSSLQQAAQGASACPSLAELPMQLGQKSQQLKQYAVEIRKHAKELPAQFSQGSVTAVVQTKVELSEDEDDSDVGEEQQLSDGGMQMAQQAKEAAQASMSQPSCTAPAQAILQASEKLDQSAKALQQQNKSVEAAVPKCEMAWQLAKAQDSGGATVMGQFVAGAPFSGAN